MIFENRKDAGTRLAKELEGSSDAVVLGLARGGVVVAAEVAKSLKLPLDVVVVRKIGAPDNEELALGAIAADGSAIFNDHLVSMLGISKEYLKKESEKQKDLANRRKDRYLKGRDPASTKGKTVILVDDGIATGASMKVAIHSVREVGAKKIVVAVPVASPESLKEISKLVDEAICLSSPSLFHSVGAFYKRFDQVSDEEVGQLLGK